MTLRRHLRGQPSRSTIVTTASAATRATSSFCVAGRAFEPRGHVLSVASRLPVMTTLGSGTATIDHTIVKTEGSVVEIAIKGEGVISGMEYNLPRLLPGAIGIVGDARFDRATGTVAALREGLGALARNRVLRNVGLAGVLASGSL